MKLVITLSRLELMKFFECCSRELTFKDYQIQRDPEDGKFVSATVKIDNYTDGDLVILEASDNMSMLL